MSARARERMCVCVCARAYVRECVVFIFLLHFDLDTLIPRLKRIFQCLPRNIQLFLTPQIPYMYFRPGSLNVCGARAY